MKYNILNFQYAFPVYIFLNSDPFEVQCEILHSNLLTLCIFNNDLYWHTSWHNNFSILKRWTKSLRNIKQLFSFVWGKAQERTLYIKRISRTCRKVLTFKCCLIKQFLSHNEIIRKLSLIEHILEIIFNEPCRGILSRETRGKSEIVLWRHWNH